MIQKNFITVLSVHFPLCFASHLEKFLIETRKSESINSLFQTLAPCQLTLITNHHSIIFSFYLKPNCLCKFSICILNSSRINLPTYFQKNPKNQPILSFLAINIYIAKLSTPICKANLFFYGNKIKPYVDNLKSWLESISNIWTVPINILSHNHISSRSVYCT